MSRTRLALFLSIAAAAAACSKPAAKDTGSPPPAGDTGRINVPGAKNVDPPKMGVGEKAAGGTPEGATVDPFKLKPEEGKLAVAAPADAKAGAEATATISVTPGTGYHVNTEYPIKLTLESATGVTLAKAEYKAGGADKAKGDAETLEEKQLLIAVKLTPAQAGNYTVNGKLKFAVCDKDSCLPKTEAIAIAVAAK